MAVGPKMQNLAAVLLAVALQAASAFSPVPLSPCPSLARMGGLQRRPGLLPAPRAPPLPARYPRRSLGARMASDWPWASKPPPMIFCVGLNYMQHATELGKPLPREPVVFAKNPGCMTQDGMNIELPKEEPCVDYEGELAVVIGDRPCKDVSEEDALSFVGGYCVVNDVSGRSWQFDRPNGGQWVRSKVFDTFLPISPMTPASEVKDPQDLTITTTLNGKVVQCASTKDMIFSVRHILKFLSISTTLLPGTIILTGTPVGVGHTSDPKRYLEDGDVVSVEISGLGRIENRAVRRK